MDDTPMTVSDLKKTKNRVIGNPVAKEALVRDGVFMRRWALLLSLSLSFSSSMWRDVVSIAGDWT